MAGQPHVYGTDGRNVVQFHTEIERNEYAFDFKRKRGSEFKYGNGSHTRIIGNGDHYRYGNLRANAHSSNQRPDI